jgi:4,4'-diaponeurosporenoate glycosyltransferase
VSGLDVVLVVVRLGIGFWLLWSLPRLGRLGSFDLGRVSVVVPARNEAAQLPRLLRSLSGTQAEVVVVDDGSTDGTASVATTHGATVVPAGPLPDGWGGKAWACEVGARASSGDVLVFVDADVRFAAGALGRVVATLDEGGGLVSVQPFHVPDAPVEHLAALFNVVAVAATDVASPLGRRRGARGGFGPVLACRRDDHERVGGHAVARDTVVDDVALAEAFRSAGLSVQVLGGGRDVAFRMYPLGLGQLVEGFTKNLAAGVGSVRRSTALLVVAWLTLLVQATVAPVRAVLGTADPATAAALYAVVAAQVWWMARKVGRFGPVIALAFPLLLLAFFGVFVRSLVATARGSVSWRGRRLPTRRSPRP